jgi:peptidylprolyl isomerase
MSLIATGTNVEVHYTGKFTNGETFDSSVGSEPLAFEIGSGMVIEGFDYAVKTMAVGETKTIQIPAAEAYGEHYPEMVIQAPRNEMPADFVPELGMTIQLQSEDGEVVEANITHIGLDTITLDANHPLAGKDLVFELELVSVG